MPTWIVTDRIMVPLHAPSVHDNMALQGQSSQDLDELNLGESGWPPFQHQILASSSSTDSHLLNSLAPEVSSFEKFPRFETSRLPPSTTHDTPEPFQCIDQNWPLNFGDLQLHRLSYDSRCNTVVPIPVAGELYGSGSVVNDSQSILDSSIVPSPLQKSFAAMQGSHDIADIGATICSMVADHLKRLGGQRNTQSTTTPLPASNDPLSTPDIRASSGILVDSQGHKLSHRSRKAQKTVNRATR